MPRLMLSGLTVTRRTVLASLTALPLIFAAGCNNGGSGTGSAARASDVKIGFIVNSAPEPWLHAVWHFADEPAKKEGLIPVKLPATDP